MEWTEKASIHRMSTAIKRLLHYATMTSLSSFIMNFIIYFDRKTNPYQRHVLHCGDQSWYLNFVWLFQGFFGCDHKFRVALYSMSVNVMLEHNTRETCLYLFHIPETTYLSIPFKFKLQTDRALLRRTDSPAVVNNTVVVTKFWLSIINSWPCALIFDCEAPIFVYKSSIYDSCRNHGNLTWYLSRFLKI